MSKQRSAYIETAFERLEANLTCGAMSLDKISDLLFEETLLY